MDGPKIGVVIPTFNRRHLVGGTLRSVLFQDAVFQEAAEQPLIVVVDDGSSDGTLESLLDEFTNHIQRVDDRLAGTVSDVSPAGNVVVIRQANRHIAGARNTGLRELLARGCTYLSHQDSDDLSLPHKLRVLSRFLDDNPRVGLVHAMSQDMAFDGFLLPEGQGPFESTYRRARPGGALWDRAARGELRRGELHQLNYVHNQTTMYTRAAVTALGEDGWFPEGVRYGEDWEFYKRLEGAGIAFGFVPTYVSISRAHASGISADRGESASVDEILSVARSAPPASKAEHYLRARWRDPQAFEAGLERTGSREDFVALVSSLHESVRRLRAARKIPEALNLAHRICLLLPSEDARAAAVELSRELVALLAPAREQALRAGDARTALALAKQVFALDPGRENAAALAHVLASAET